MLAAIPQSCCTHARSRGVGDEMRAMIWEYVQPHVDVDGVKAIKKRLLHFWLAGVSEQRVSSRRVLDRVGGPEGDRTRSRAEPRPHARAHAHSATYRRSRTSLRIRSSQQRRNWPLLKASPPSADISIYAIAAGGCWTHRHLILRP